MSKRFWRPYVPVAKRQNEARKMVAKAKKSEKKMNPVIIEGRTIAKSFWGKAWCDNLEAYSDFSNRLPRGRSYARNGSIVDLFIEPGRVRAQVMGSYLYTIEIAITPATKERWTRLVKECTGTISSLVELLQGKFSKTVMERICHPQSGLFPTPKEITLNCSCPDWATMCKHVAAALYGVGARLDSSPELLFILRHVDPSDLIAEASQTSIGAQSSPDKERLLDSDGLADLFGIEMAVASPLEKSGKKTKKASATKPSSSLKDAKMSVSDKEPVKKRTSGNAATRKPSAKEKPSSPRRSEKPVVAKDKVKSGTSGRSMTANPKITGRRLSPSGSEEKVGTRKRPSKKPL